LPFRANEQDTAASGDNVTHREERLVEERNGLGQIDNMDIVADPEDVRGHFGVPTLGAVAEMRARLQKLAQIVFRQCHQRLLFSGYSLARE
jgi:hypothetical protein